jgi:hypothetical protein
MKELRLVKVPGGFRVPYDDDVARIKTIANGTLVFANIKQPRNHAYLQRFFCLLKYAYNFWDPPPTEYQGIPVHKDFETFREQVTIAAGYSVMSVSLVGSIEFKAKSISFASMDEETFRKLYDAVFNTLWDLVLETVPGMTEAEAHNAVNSMLSYE